MKLVAKFEKTNMTRGAFADEHKVKRRTFYHWLYKLRWEKEAHKKPKAKPGFVEVKLDGSSRAVLVGFRNGPQAEARQQHCRGPAEDYCSGNNMMFVGNDEAGDNLAILQSLVATCELNGVNPLTYLTDVLIRIQDHPMNAIDDLLPQNWRPPD